MNKDKEIVLNIGKTIIDFWDALYHGVCSKCGNAIEWEADLDADGTTYSADCCELIYFMKNHTVEIEVENA